MLKLKEAISIIGGNAAFARAMGVKPQFITQLLNGDRSVPPDRALDVEEATDGKVMAEDICDRHDYLAFLRARRAAAKNPERAA